MKVQNNDQFAINGNQVEQQYILNLKPVNTLNIEKKLKQFKNRLCTLNSNEFSIHLNY